MGSQHAAKTRGAAHEQLRDAPGASRTKDRQLSPPIGGVRGDRSWHGAEIIAPRRWLCGARQPPERTRWTRGRGTRAASFSKSSIGGGPRG
jgi:hypothetical protein